MAFWRKQTTDRARAAPGPPARLEVDRLIEKRRYKDAVKQAKLCYRAEATPEHHRLLEQAYFLRARQLREGGMPSASQEVARHLVEFGITDPELFGPAAELLVAVGMTARALELQGRQDDPEARQQLVRRAADQAVLHPERSSGAPPEVLQGAGQVRRALEALESGDEEGARAALKDVARGSPFGDWKWFVRGLAAFRRRTPEECRASWDRLDPDRAPSRIARAIRGLDGHVPDAGSIQGPAAGPDAASALEGFERKVFGEPVLGPLRTLGTLIAQDRWAEAIKVLRTLRLALRRVDPALAERLTRVLYSPMIDSVTRLEYREAQRLVRDFAGAAEPLAIDPRWNRLWALIWEGPQGHVDDAEPFWRKYLKDLDASSALRVEERPLAKALVLTHLGWQFVGEASAFEGLGPHAPPRVSAESVKARTRAVDTLEESLRLCPTLRRTYQVLIDAQWAWGQPEEALAVRRRLLEVYPDDVDTLMDLVDHFRRDDPGRALEYARRARTLKPLDPEARDREWAALVSLAREHALKRRFDEARDAFEAADRLQPESSRSLPVLARKAALELKAGRDDRADALIAEARGLLEEPGPLWLALLIEARRYKLSKAKREPFEQHWDGSLAMKCRGETAGALAGLLAPFLAEDVSYTGRESHVRQVVDYLRRTTRLTYRRADLAEVCGLLGLVPRERKLFETLVRRGVKHFPDAPEFLLMLGALELEKGPFGGDLRGAQRHFERALSLAEAQAMTDPKAAALVPRIRESLTGLEDLTSGPFGSPFGGSPFGGSPFGGPGGRMPDPSTLPPELLDMFEGLADAMGFDPDDLFDDDDDDDGGPGPFSTPAPRPRRPSPKKKKTKKR